MRLRVGNIQNQMSWFLAIPLASAAGSESVEVSTLLTGDESAVRARFWVPAPPERVLELIKDVPRYPEVLPPISRAAFLEPDVVHLTISLPWPMSARDSVSRVSESVDGAVTVLQWTPTAGPPPEPGVVRLEQSHGSWRIEPAEGGTQVTYESYNTAPANVPEPILKAIHRIEGNRLARNLREAVDGG